MLPPNSSSTPPRLAMLQVLVAAFMSGVLLFVLVAMFLRPTGGATAGGAAAAGRGPDDLFLGITAVLLLNAAALGLFFRANAVKRARVEHDAGPGLPIEALLQRFGTVTILRAALAEGAALMGAATTLLTGNTVALGGAAVGLILLGSVFPSRARFEAFVRDVTGRTPGM